MHRRPPSPTLFPYTTLFRSLCDPYVAVGDDALVVAVSILDLLDVLSDEVRLDPVSSDVGEGRFEDGHLPQAWKFIDEEQQAMVRARGKLLVLLERLFDPRISDFFEFFRQPVDGHCEDQPQQRFQAFDVARRHNQIEAHRILEMFEIVDREIALLDASLNKRVAIEDE